MRHATLLLATGAALLCGTLACAAAEPDTAAAPTTSPDMGRMHHRMMDKDGEHGGKGHRCMHHGPMMGGGPMMDGAMLSLPSLPPGNDKLQVQMQAEMMQKIGEILAKYASQVKDAPAP